MDKDPECELGISVPFSIPSGDGMQHLHFIPGPLHAIPKRMKKFLVILLLVIIAVLYYRHPGGSPNQPAATPAPAYPPGTNYFKQPLDRTHEVLDQVRKQRRDDNY